MTTLIIAGGDLFRVALQQLGDATQWNRIAALNNIDDPVLEGISELKLPDISANAGGGFAE